MYYIKISKFYLILFLIIAIFFTIASFGVFGFLLIVPVCFFFILRSCKYYYDDERLIMEKGVFVKKQQIIPLYRIVNITANENIFKCGIIRIMDKQQTIELKYVEHPKEEMMKLTEKWEKAKEGNDRNEVI